MFYERRATKNWIVNELFGNKGLTHFWESRFLPRWLPVLAGLTLALIIPVLIAAEFWLLVSSLVLIVPIAILFSRYPFACFLLWFLLTPLVITPSGRTYLVLFWILHRAMIPAGLIGVLLPYLFKIREAWPIRLGRAELAIAVGMGYVIVSSILLNSNTFGALYKAYDRFFISYCLYLLIRFTAPREKEFKLLVWAAFLQLIFQSAVGLLANFAPGVLPAMWYNSQSRTVGTFNAPGRYTSTLVFGMLIVYQAAMQWRGKKVHWPLLFAFVLGSLMIFLTQAKASWLAGSVALLGVVLLYPRATLRTAVLAGILMALFGTTLLAEQLTYARQRLEDDSSNQRMITNVAMLNMIRAKPIFGWGYENLRDHIEEHVVQLENFAAKESAPHNTYLPIMVDLGLVGFFLYIFPFIWWLIVSFRVWPKMPKRGLLSRSFVVMLWLAILAHVVTASTSDFRNGQSGVYTISLWWVTLGFIASLVYPYEEPLPEVKTVKLSSLEKLVNPNST